MENCFLRIFFVLVCVYQGASSKLLNSFRYFFSPLNAQKHLVRIVFWHVNANQSSVSLSHTHSPSQYRMIHHYIGTAYYLPIPRLIYIIYFVFFFHSSKDAVRSFWLLLYHHARRVKICRIGKKIWSFATTATAADASVLRQGGRGKKCDLVKQKDHSHHFCLQPGPQSMFSREIVCHFMPIFFLSPLFRMVIPAKLTPFFIFGSASYEYTL